MFDAMLTSVGDEPGHREVRWDGRRFRVWRVRPGPPKPGYQFGWHRRRVHLTRRQRESFPHPR